MNPIIPFEYTLYLSTGETLEISEIDLSIIQASDQILSLCHPIISQCTFVTREELEQAKGQYDSPFKAKLRSFPPGCLTKNRNPVCSQIDSCIMADKKKCTTKNISKTGGNFPRCWTFQLDEVDSLVKFQAIELADVVIHCWREGRLVIIVQRD